MPITVGELVELPHLQLRVQAGTGGLDREVTWTHTTDLPRPWEWVGGGELLMTNGMSIPDDAAGQEQVLRNLYAHEIAGLAIGEEMFCPALTAEMLEVSEELGLPVLWIAYPMPFVSISRTVAEATLLEQSQRLIRTERIYKVLQRLSADDEDLSALLTVLAKELACEVTVCDRSSGRAWSGERASQERVEHAVVEAHGQLRAGMTATHDAEGGRLLLVDVPTHADAVLVCSVDERYQPDAVLLQHAATVVALALHQLLLTIEHRRRSGTELLLQLFDGNVPATAFVAGLARHGLDVDDSVVVASRCDDESRLRSLHVELWRRGVAHMTVQRADTTTSVVAGDAPALEAYRETLGSTSRLGVSEPLASAERFGDARREAAWALGVATDENEPTVHYGTADPMLGPRTPDEAGAVVARVLGPVLELGDGDSRELLRTLRTFLDEQRSWQRTADALHLHRQTVLYRIRKVERLTGRKLNDTADLAAIWIALRAMERFVA